MENLSIKVKEHHVLSPFEWKNVPSFSIITGANGVGKTMLLEGINEFYNSPIPRSRMNSPIIKPIEILPNFFKGEVVYLDSNGFGINTVPSIRAIDISTNISKAYGEFKISDSSLVFEKIVSKVGKSKEQITIEEFERFYELPNILNFSSLFESTARRFVEYFKNRREWIADSLSKEDFVEKNGSEPWVRLNKLLDEANLPYSFVAPTKYDINEIGYTLRVLSKNGKEIQLMHLSSGEKAILSLVLYVFIAESKGVMPKLLLLDEPDAHLHPQMTKYFLDVITKVLVKEYHIKVMMSTHSPSTVALAPEASLFELQKSPSLVKKISKNRAISLLTSGLIIVTQATKYVFVEDKEDVNFYSKIYRIAIDTELIKSDITLVFVAASTETQSGGKLKVKEWQDKLSLLSSQFEGLIDEDYDNSTTLAHDFSTLTKLTRYSIENFWADPLCIYTTMVKQGWILDIADVNVKKGEEYMMKFLSQIHLQRIVDKIISIIEASANSYVSNNSMTLDRSLIDVTFHIKKNFVAVEKELPKTVTLQYPKWILDIRGKDLARQLVTNGLSENGFKKNCVNVKFLSETFESSQFIPKEIIDIFINIQMK